VVSHAVVPVTPSTVKPRGKRSTKETATHLGVSQVPHSTTFSWPHATSVAGMEQHDSQMVFMVSKGVT
jgi:hypothetical protein